MTLGNCARKRRKLPAAGKHKRALAAYLELETLEPRDAQWPKRAAETYRKLARNNDAIDAFTRAADRYAQGGFLVQAIAVCKLILQIDPRHDAALQRIAAMNEQIGAGPTRAVAMADNNPNLAENTAVAALRRRGTTEPAADPRIVDLEPQVAIPRTRTPNPTLLRRSADRRQGTQTPPFELGGRRARATARRSKRSTTSSLPRTKTSNAQSQVAQARTKSKPITLPPNSGIDAIDLKTEVPDAFEREENSGVYVIPIDDEDFTMIEDRDRRCRRSWSSRRPRGSSSNRAELDDIAELDLEDIEEIPLPAPRVLGHAAAEALAATPLFSGLSQEALESLVAELQLDPARRAARCCFTRAIRATRCT